MDDIYRQRPKAVRMECAFGHLTVGRSPANAHAGDDVRQAPHAGILRPLRMPHLDDDARDRSALDSLTDLNLQCLSQVFLRGDVDLFAP